MESSPRRKRKGIATIAPHFSCGDDNFDPCRKRFREERRSDDEKIRSCDRKAVMTAPPCGGSSSIGCPGRGLKRKLGCVDLVIRVCRKKKLEQEYVVGRSIGQGKFGSVRLCRSRVGRGEEFACKSLAKNGEETVQREVEIMQHLSGHPGVVTLKAVFEDSDCFHLVMELCSGGRLLDCMVREGSFSEQGAARMVKELVSVIKYCHEMGVVHRDVKPENILLTASGKMKLADFGLAVRVTNGQKLTGIAGSPAYVAPEVLLGHYTEKVDIWGAGVLLHALLVGFLPFQGESRDAVFEAIKTVDLNFHTGVWEPISKLARDLISRMLTRDVSKRLSAEEVLRHPWIMFYTEFLPNSLPFEPQIRTNHSTVSRGVINRVQENGRPHIPISHSSGSSTQNSEEVDSNGFADALAAAIGRVRISEPKRSRLCATPTPVQQECSSNLKANLCAAF